MIMKNDEDGIKTFASNMKRRTFNDIERNHLYKIMDRQIKMFGYKYQDSIHTLNKNLIYKVMKKYELKYIDSHLKIGIHVPPMGALKYLMENWADTFVHLGIEVVMLQFNNNSIDPVEKRNNFRRFVEQTNITDFITVGVPYYTDEINKAILKISGVRLGYIMDDTNKEPDINDYYISANINADEKFLDKDVIKVPFGANVLKHYKRCAPKLLDYAFIGTLSHIKRKETDNYFGRILKQSNNGIFGGGQWPLGIGIVSNEYASMLYSFAKVCPNYHLKHQIDEPNEVNDRTYTIAACGEFQIVDNPAIMKDLYTDDEMCVTYNPKEYEEAYKYYINNPSHRDIFIQNGMKKTIQNYTLFHRLEVLCDYLQGKK